MLNKTNIFKILMIFATMFIIYGFLVAFDYFFHLQKYKSYKLANEIITGRKQNEDRKYILDAKDLGYEFIVYPYLYADNKNLKEFAEKLEIIPVNGQPNSKVYYCNEGYGLIKFKTDRLGFRNNDMVWDKISGSQKKIVFIGDSYTQGACVKENEPISSYFDDYVTYNLGLDGNNPAIYSSLSKLFIPKIKPDFVVQLFYVNDFNERNEDFFAKNLKVPNLEERYFKNNSSIELSNEILDIINNAKIIMTEIPNRLPGERPNVLVRGVRYLTLPTLRMYFSLIYNKNTETFSMYGNVRIDSDQRSMQSQEAQIDDKNEQIVLINDCEINEDNKHKIYGDKIILYFKNNELINFEVLSKGKVFTTNTGYEKKDKNTQDLVKI